MKWRTGLSYDDVLLVPQYSDIRSRREINLESSLDNNIVLKLPIISSPMDTVTESAMASRMSQCGGLGIVHRYNTIAQQVEITKNIHKGSQYGCALGVKGDFIERAQELYLNGTRMFCLDVAHGHHVMMKEALREIKTLFQGSDVHIMAGNVATRDAFEDLANWGADSIRCNIGGGSICSTRIQTGHGLPGFETILDCFNANIKRDVKIIADGGIRNSGDIVKALAAGADFVMLGSILAGTIESPGTIVIDANGNKRKVYRGMASKEAQFNWKGSHGSNEGIATTVPYKGEASQILIELENGIRSGLSYSGARTILELQTKAKFIIQTNAGQSESRTHILGAN